MILRSYIALRCNYLTDTEPFFVYADRSPILAVSVRKTLKMLLKKIGLDSTVYNCHSFRIGRSTDLFKYGYDVERIKRLGRWRSNAVYKYLRS